MSIKEDNEVIDLVPSTDEESTGYVRLGILLPLDTVSKIDLLKDKARLSSRGRTIEVLVDTILAVRSDAKVLLLILQQFSQASKDVTMLLLSMLPNITGIISHLGLFGTE